jgi:hypothetical protein
MASLAKAVKPRRCCVTERLGREQHITDQLTRLKSQVAEFESHYGWASEEFYPRFERGELGDDMDLMEWSATIEMIREIEEDPRKETATDA